MILSKHAVSRYLHRDFDSWAWMKRLTRQQILAELNYLRVKPKFKTDPWLHQLVAFYIAAKKSRFLMLLDMGLGKTKIITDIMTQLQRERKLKGALVCVPRIINIDSWTEDLVQHSDLEPWSCGVQDIEEKWERLAYPKGDVSIIDYQGLQWALCYKVPSKGRRKKLELDPVKVAHLQRQYNFIDLDESHKLSSYDNLWFRMMDELCGAMDFCYATTGTLFSNDPTDLWSQFYLVDRGETFGENMALFQASLFDVKKNPWKGDVYEFNKRNQPQLHRMLQHRSLRYDEDEVLDLPMRVSRRRNYEMGAEQREHYLRALEGLINANGQLTLLEANWLRMRQITSGYLAWKDEHGNHVLPFKHNPKLDGLEQLIEERGNSKVVISYEYTETGRLIAERVKSMKLGFEWYYGGTQDKSGSRRRFLDDPACQVFIMQSDAGGTGNDGLQKVARYLVLFETPSHPTPRKQVIKRIHRPGQEFRSFIYDLVMLGTLDKGLLVKIQEGIDLYDVVVNGRDKGLNMRNFLTGRL